MPEEIILNILRFLPAKRLCSDVCVVCRQLYRLCNSQAVWRDLFVDRWCEPPSGWPGSTLWLSGVHWKSHYVHKAALSPNPGATMTWKTALTWKGQVASQRFVHTVTALNDYHLLLLGGKEQADDRLNDAYIMDFKSFTSVKVQVKSTIPPLTARFFTNMGWNRYDKNSSTYSM